MVDDLKAYLSVSSDFVLTLTAIAGLGSGTRKTTIFFFIMHLERKDKMSRKKKIRREKEVEMMRV